MPPENETRLQTELDLLQAIYPDHLHYHSHTLTYTTSNSTLKLRLPSTYPQDTHPELLLASTAKQDLRTELQKIILTLPTGEEILDAIILEFTDLTRITNSTLESEHEQTTSNLTPVPAPARKITVLIWLHHLLNTNKRKQCLSPDAGVSGVTKPGYPGVLIYAGSYEAVHAHVRELKGLNWAGFQVRLEVEEEWVFRHGEGMVEVEGMKDVVDEVGERKDAFLEGMRMK